MTIHNLNIVTFEQYLNIKKGFVQRSIKHLESTSIKKLLAEGFSDEQEIRDTIKYQKNERKNVNRMLKFQKFANEGKVEE